MKVRENTAGDRPKTCFNGKEASNLLCLDFRGIVGLLENYLASIIGFEKFGFTFTTFI